MATELLQDIREVFRKYKQDRLKVTEMVQHLRVLEGAPWDDLDRNGLTPHKLGRLLKNYGIRSKPIRFPSGTARGFDKADFVDTWTRYLTTEMVTGATTLEAVDGP